MTRLQKKCLVGSACFHGLTVVVFLVTAAFRSEPPVTTEQVMTLFSPTIVDSPTRGGNPLPAVRAEAAQPALPAPAAPPPARFTPAPIPPLPVPAGPPKNIVKNTPKPPARETAPVKPSVEPAPKKHEIDVDLTQTTSSKKPSKSTDTAAQSRAAAQAAARAADKKRAQEIADVFAGLDSALHSTEPASKVVALSTGTGGEGGGEAFVNYRTAVFNAYYQAWKTPDGTTHNLAVTDAKIVVQRDGTVSFSEIVNKSGDTAVDRSVQRALDAVRHLPPFPPGALDAERSFIIRFNLEAKQEAG